MIAVNTFASRITSWVESGVVSFISSTWQLHTANAARILNTNLFFIALFFLPFTINIFYFFCFTAADYALITHIQSLR